MDTRNYKVAARLCESGIPTAYPLAALSKKTGIQTVQTVFITEYIENSTDLYRFLRDNVSQTDSADNASAQIKKQVADQVTNIFSRLNQIRLWHRDAKAGNFLVSSTSPDCFKVMLVDMDGIKPFLFNTFRKRFFPFAKLGSVLMWHRGINLTDYLRSFRIYCNLTAIDKEKRGRVFRRLSRSAVAQRLFSFASSAIKK